MAFPDHQHHPEMQVATRSSAVQVTISAWGWQYLGGSVSTSCVVARLCTPPAGDTARLIDPDKISSSIPQSCIHSCGNKQKHGISFVSTTLLYAL